METVVNSVQTFVIDSLIQSSANKDLIYAFLPQLGLDYNELYAQLTTKDHGDLNGLFAQFYQVVQKSIQSNVKFAHGGQLTEIEEVYFHPKFGWVVKCELGKAYLGKISLPQKFTMKVGLMSYFSGNSTVIGEQLEIGSFCSIASGAYIITQDYNHPITQPSTYNFQENLRIKSEGMQFDLALEPGQDAENKVTIGNDVWFGRDVTVMNGVTLGDGCVIGTKSLVTKNCEPYGIYGGVPARLIRYRFSEDVIRQLLEIKWWNWSLDRIKRNAAFFSTDLTQNWRNLKSLVVA